MTKVLGIIGGGQLGMMLTEAAKKMPQYISDVIVLDPVENCPASRVGAKQIVADFKDKNAIVELSLQSDIITYEIESGNSEVLESLHGEVSINPSPSTLKIIQDKYFQKQFLSKNNIPVAEFKSVESLEDLKNKIVDFKMEVSVIASRNIHGEIATYPLVENIHKDNILQFTIAPARVSDKIASESDSIAKKTMEVLHGAGVFGIEMFVTRDDKVLINEIAPRVHNSGHHTLQSSQTSQFEQHLRAILGLPLGDTRLKHNTVMYNILGPKDFSGKYKPVILEQKDGVYLKMYHKDDAKPQRKLGHFNVVDEQDTKNVELLIKRAQEIRDSIKFIQQD